MIFLKSKISKQYPELKNSDYPYIAIKSLMVSSASQIQTFILSVCNVYSELMHYRLVILVALQQLH